MATTKRITVTLPAEQVDELKEITDNISGYVAEAVAQQVRRRNLRDGLRWYQEEYGEFTEEERREARDTFERAADGLLANQQLASCV